MVRLLISVLSLALTSTAHAELSLPNLFNSPVFALQSDQTLPPAKLPGHLNVGVIKQATGMLGSFDQKTQSYKITLSRDDMSINVNGAQMTAGMGLNTSVSFKMIDQQNINVNGVLALTENQVNAVLTTALENHFTVTELHNHLLWESPKVMFLHFEGTGPQTILAENVGRVLRKVKATSNGKGDFPLGYIDASQTNFNTKKVNAILGVNNRIKNGVYRVAIKPNHTQSDLNVNNIEAKAIFAGSENAAVVDGTFVLSSGDLEKVLRAFRKANIAIVEIHQHGVESLADNMLYLHYWGIGSAQHLAHGVKNAFDAAQQNEEKLASLKSSQPVAHPNPSFAFGSRAFLGLKTQLQ